MQTSKQCQVCFTNPPLLHSYHSFIQCINCGATAHRYCYYPSCNGDIVCDSCKFDYKGNCNICENPGLLKKGDRIFAHPVCLLLSHGHLGNGAYLVNSFNELSFMPAQIGKLPKRTKCSECSKTNPAVLACSSNCNNACHIYCAMKSRNPIQGKGWNVNLPYANPCDFSDLFQHIANRKLTAYHDFLKKKLNLNKQGKRQQVRIYCQQHSLTIVDCHCRIYSEEPSEWIYCEGCCRWIHLKCVNNLQEAKQTIKNSTPFLCTHCKLWRHAIEQPKLYLPEHLPKLHLYDFIFIQTYMEKQKYEVPPSLLDLALRMPILPGKEYIEIQYRKEVVILLRNTIDFMEFRKQVESCEDENLMKYTKIFSRAKDRLFYMWWLCQGEMLGQKMKKEVPFLMRNQEEPFELEVIKQVFDLLIKFNLKFFSSKPQQLIAIKNKLEGGRPDLTTKSIVPESKEDSAKSATKLEKTLESLCEQIRALLIKLKDNTSRQNAIVRIGELHSLLNSPQVAPYHDELPNIPFVQTCILFKKKQVALRYLAGLSDLEVLKTAWKDVSIKQTNTSVKEKLVAFANRFLQVRIYEERDELIRSLLLKEWANLEMNDLVPSQILCFAEPESFIPTLTFQGLNLKKINDILTRLQKNFRNCTKGALELQDFSTMQQFLETMLIFSFTKTSIANLQLLLNDKWQGNMTKHIPKVVQQFINLFQMTSNLINANERIYDGSICVFEFWKRIAFIDNLSISKYGAYYQDIWQTKLDLFPKVVFQTLKAKLAMLIQRMEERTPIFESEAQFRLLTRWCAKLQVFPARAGEMMEQDRTFQHGVNLIRPNFDNIEAVKRLSEFLDQHLKCFKQYGMEFRVQQIKVMLNWIYLYNTVLQKVPLSLLLAKQQLECLDMPTISTKPNCFDLREILTHMKKFHFPECQFLHKFQQVVEEGERINALIVRVLDQCDWGYDLSQDYGEKMTLEEFQNIYDSVKNSPFSFEAELIEFDIIRDKLDEAERQAQFLSIEYKRTPECSYLQEKAKRLLISFGCFPISSKSPQFLWSIFQQPKKQGLPENLQAYISQVAQSHRLHSWRQLENLQINIDTKLESKFFKNDSSNRLKALIASNKLFAQKCSPLLKKWNEGMVLNDSQLEQLGKLLQEEKLLQFEDEELARIRLDYNFYRMTYEYIKADARWHQLYRAYNAIQLNFLNTKISQLHPSFVSPEIVRIKTKMEQELYRETHQIIKADTQRQGKGRAANEGEKQKMKARQKDGEKEFDRSSRSSSKMNEMSSLESNVSSKKESNVRPKPDKRSFNRSQVRHEKYY